MTETTKGPNPTQIAQGCAGCGCLTLLTLGFIGILLSFCAAEKGPIPPEKPYPRRVEGGGGIKREQSSGGSVNENKHVSDNLNAADMMFKGGMDGCPSVGVAIMAANSPTIYGPTSPSQMQELKRYAQRCNLRF
jgi:hypothetical protein